MMRICYILSFGFLAFVFLGMVELPAAAMDYDPAPQADTVMCAPGTDDCDGLAANGCETNLNDVTSCGSCTHNCTECREQPTCTGMVCGGPPRRDFTACRNLNCTTVGVCMAGECVCPDGAVDMARPPFPP